MLAQIVQHALSSKYNLTLVTAEKARRLRITHWHIIFIIKQSAILQSSP